MPIIAPESILWREPPQGDRHVVDQICRKFSLPRVLAELIVRSGADPESFLEPRLQHLSDPFLLPDMAKAVERIFAAIDSGERIVLYGDYDVDGVTSLAFLLKVLIQYRAQVAPFLPHRIDEGYGLNPDGIARCVSTLKPNLLIAVDCGTSSAVEIAELSNQGIDVIVLDHHECPAQIPKCVALVNPKVGKSSHYLCSAGLAFKLGHALVKTRKIDSLDLRNLLELVALGTVADIVPLVEENRILVAAGSKKLAHSGSVGIRALKKVSGLEGEVRSDHIGFRLGPRLNAAGRLDSAEASLRLLTTEDPEEAEMLASELNDQNSARQDVEKRTLAEAEIQLETLELRKSVVVGAVGWHPGVAGIVAARLCRKYYRPTLVIGFDENGRGKGSGRSVRGVSLVSALAGCSSLLLKHGGHEMAAGLSMEFTRLEELRAAFDQLIHETYDETLFTPVLELDGEVQLDEINLEFLGQHERLQPFGAGNSQPVFLSRNVMPVGEPRVLKEKHLKLKLRGRGMPKDAIYFSGATQPLPKTPWDIAFKIEPNFYRDLMQLQLQIVGIRATDG